MNEAARHANENMHRREVLGLLKSIDAALKILVERSTPVNITINSPDLKTGPVPSLIYPWVNS